MEEGELCFQYSREFLAKHQQLPKVPGNWVVPDDPVITATLPRISLSRQIWTFDRNPKETGTKAAVLKQKCNMLVRACNPSTLEKKKKKSFSERSTGS